MLQSRVLGTRAAHAHASKRPRLAPPCAHNGPGHQEHFCQRVRWPRLCAASGRARYTVESATAAAAAIASPVTRDTSLPQSASAPQRSGAAEVISQLSLSTDGAQLLLQQPDLFVRRPVMQSASVAARHARLSDPPTGGHCKSGQSKYQGRCSCSCCSLCGESRAVYFSLIYCLLRAIAVCQQLPPPPHTPIKHQQNLCSHESAAPIFANAQAFHRIGTLLTGSRSPEFLRTTSMCALTSRPQPLRCCHLTSCVRAIKRCCPLQSSCTLF